MKKAISALIIYFILFGILPLTYAAWQGPIELIVGQWGEDSHQFGIERGDTGDIFPKSFGVSNSGKVVIADNINEVLHIFNSDGSVWKNISKPVKRKWWPYTVIVNGECAVVAYTDYTHIFDLETGKLKSVANNIGGASYISNDCLKIYVYKGSKKWKAYSLTGQLLETYKEKPLELGKVKKLRKAEGYIYKIQYPDLTDSRNTKTYTLKLPEGVERFKRDMNGYLYVTSLSPGKHTNQIIFRYDQCEEAITKMQIPDSQYNITYITDKPHPIGYEIELIVEYGKPVIAPNGDVYTWKRTPDTYSIIKWVWIESPDAPVNLKAAASKDKISLSWEKPAQDAGTVKSYEIYRSSYVCGPFNKIKKVKKDILNYADKKVKESETYYYQVCAERGSGYSGYSNKAVGSIKN